jgi:hypothetical protein
MENSLFDVALAVSSQNNNLNAVSSTNSTNQLLELVGSPNYGQYTQKPRNHSYSLYK